MTSTNLTTDKPLVSVVIPTFNYGHYVCEAVDSALQQTYPKIEILVIDDGSTDDTQDRLKPYGDRIRVIYQQNQGLSAARNTGIREAKGDFVALLDSDDAFHPRKIEWQMDHLRTYPEVGIVGTISWTDPENRFPELTFDPGKITNISLDDVVLKSRFSPSSALIRKTYFEQVGEFDTSLRSVEDRDMWIRLATKTKTSRIDLPLTWYRVQQVSMSKNAARMEEFEHIVLNKAFALPELKSRWFLKRRAFGLAHYSASYLYLITGERGKALNRIRKSFLAWPGLYPVADVNHPFGRVRLLIGIVKQMLLGSSSAKETTQTGTTELVTTQAVRSVPLDSAS